jgi:hypothetical protein
MLVPPILAISIETASTWRASSFESSVVLRQAH